MLRRRSTVLFIVLVALPLALLAWLGTYLMRDAAKRTDASMQAILAERLSSADHQLVHDLRQLTDEFDAMAGTASTAMAAAAGLAQHPWAARAWVLSEKTALQEMASKTAFEPLMEISPEEQMSELRSRALSLGPNPEYVVPDPRGGPPFQRISPSFIATSSTERRKAPWQTFQKLGGYHIHETTTPGSQARSASGWHVAEQSFMYWNKFPDGSVVGLLLNTHLLMQGLFARLPHPGLEVPPGRMMLAGLRGVPLHQWGKRLEGAERPPSAHRACSEPLGQWELAYTPADEEFPKPYLFPIMLGMGSGVMLVIVLAWLYFHESARELSVAQQRVTFVNQISHELKTPLTNIRLYAEMAAHRAESTGDGTMKRQLSVVENETSRLDRLIQNVLNYARQQRDKLTISPKPVSLDDIATRAIEFWRPTLEAKGFEVRVELHGPPVIQADADALSQILSNLLSNVEKYGLAGRYVGLRTEVEGDTARVIVEDRGPGIPASKRKTVFEPFERLRSDLNEGVSGTGIGLTISRELTQLHGGKLVVCSQYREGARFILTLPVQLSTTAPS
ncbi:MAG: Alginate biosynthesis sensor protein KinB [Verrucomicrobiota bacterium]